MSDAVVLLSGGQDSTTSLYWAKEQFDSVRAVSFDYGQRHRIELESSAQVAEMAKVSRKVITLSCLSNLGGSALIDPGEDIISPEKGLPTSFVPGRNILFLTLAAAYAYQMGIHDLVGGMCQTDFSGYPDCRRVVIDAVQCACTGGMDSYFTIHTPLMFLTKVESVKLAKTLSGCWGALAYSHTCYEGLCPPCGKCPACVIRAEGFSNAEEVDPLILRTVGN